MKNRPYFFLFTLLLILFFILGVRYGQQVEKNNKIVDYLLKLPTPTLPISPTPPVYTEYKSKKWGLKFIYPDNLKIKESTNTPEIFIK